jgi:hypothetical protein
MHRRAAEEAAQGAAVAMHVHRWRRPLHEQRTTAASAALQRFMGGTLGNHPPHDFGGAIGARAVVIGHGASIGQRP